MKSRLLKDIKDYHDRDIRNYEDMTTAVYEYDPETAKLKIEELRKAVEEHLNFIQFLIASEFLLINPNLSQLITPNLAYDFIMDKMDFGRLISGYEYYNHLVEESSLSDETKLELFKEIKDDQDRYIKIYEQLTPKTYKYDDPELMDMRRIRDWDMDIISLDIISQLYLIKN
jgi:hypothetical protein